MIFFDIYKGLCLFFVKLCYQIFFVVIVMSEVVLNLVGGDGFSKLDWVNDEYVDLLSRDKVKQKEVVKCYFFVKVKNDWVFKWLLVSFDIVVVIFVIYFEKVDIVFMNGKVSDGEVSG